MAISFVGGSYARDGNGPNVSTDLSSMDTGTIASGDFAIAVVNKDQDDGTAIGQTAGDTFTVLHQDQSAAGRDRTVAVFYRVLDGTETTITFADTADTGEEIGVGVAVFRGVDNTTPFDVTFVAGSHYTEGQNNYNGTPDAITTVTDAAWVVICQTITHDDITTAGPPTNYTERIDGTGTNNDNSQVYICSREIASAGTETPGAMTHTVNNTVSEANFWTLALRPSGNDPTISDVETDEDFRDGDTGVTITGTNFEATQGTGKVELTQGATYTGAVAQTVTSWGATSIDITAVLSTLNPGTCYLWVTNDTGDRNSSGFEVTVRRKVEISLFNSANVTNGAATTAQLTAPSGSPTFSSGFQMDTAAETTAKDHASDVYTENVVWMEFTSDAPDSQQYEFLIHWDDAAHDTETVAPKISKGTSGSTYDETGLATTATFTTDVADTQTYTETLATTATFTTDVADTQTYTETLATTAAFTTAVADLQSYLDTGLATTITFTTDATDTQTYTETGLATTVVFTTALVDLVKYDESNLTTTATFTTALADAQNYLDTSLATTVAFTTTVVDSQDYLDTGLATTITFTTDVTDDVAGAYDETGRATTITFTTDATDTQTYVEDLATIATVTTDVTDSQDYLDTGLATTITFTTDVADTSDTAEALSTTITFTTDATDTQVYVESLATTATFTTDVADVLTLLEALSTTITFTTAATDTQVYVESLATTATVTTDVTDSQDYLDTGLATTITFTTAANIPAVLAILRATTIILTDPRSTLGATNRRSTQIETDERVTLPL